MNPILAPFLLSRSQWDLMREDVAARLPEEACGLLLGSAGRVLSVVPVTNVLHSPVRYRMDPAEQLRAFILIEDNGWDLSGIYHSHPYGPAAPSGTDIEECYYPDVTQLIWFKKNGEWFCNGFTIKAGLVTAIPVKIVEGE